MLDQSYYEVADKIIEKYGKKPSSLIPVMQDIQAEYQIGRASCRERV